MLELDCRHLRSPLPVLLLKRKVGQNNPNKPEKVKILLASDFKDNQKDIEDFNVMSKAGYNFSRTGYGVLLTT
jgi:hypothetical protein